MICVLTHHWAKPDMVTKAYRILDGNGLVQSKFPGFSRRETLLSLGEATKITTLVWWESSEI
jgi:hypothetical protein